MLLDLRPSTTRPRDVAVDGAAALRMATALGHPRPILLAYHPPAESPFISALYSRSLAAGVAAIPLPKVSDAAALVPLARAVGARVVVHLHWLNKVIAGSRTEAEAIARTDAFVALLDELRAAGVAFAWTVHNVLPHDTDMPGPHIALRRAVVDRAAVVHVMASATEAIVEPQFTIPQERILRVPHPAFTGVYPDWVDAASARRVLGIAPRIPAVGLTGALKPYKGIDQLLDALPLLARRRPRIHAVVAGTPDPTAEMDRVVDRALADPRVLIHPRWVPDDQLQNLMRGVDAVALPYRRVLNPAALFLALAFDRPVVIPDDPAVRELADPAAVVTYERGSAEALAAAIDAAIDLPREGVAAAGRRICRERDPATISRRFAEGLRSRIEA